MKIDTQLLDIFLHHAGLEKEYHPDATTVGLITPKDSEAGVQGVMEAHVKTIDFHLRTLPANSPDAIRLLSARGITFKEYLQLFNTKITERSFGDFIAFRYLFISKEKERQRLFNSLSPTYEDYCRFVLLQCFQAHGYYHLPTFFFRESVEGSYRSQVSRAVLWSYWGWEIKTVRIYV